MRAEGRGGKTGKVCFDGRGERDGRRSLFKEALCGPDFLRLNVSAFIPVRSSSLLFFLGGNSPCETKRSLSALKAQLYVGAVQHDVIWIRLAFSFFLFCRVASAVLVLEKSLFKCAILWGATVLAHYRLTRPLIP